MAGEDGLKEVVKTNEKGSNKGKQKLDTGLLLIVLGVVFFGLSALQFFIDLPFDAVTGVLLFFGVLKKLDLV